MTTTSTGKAAEDAATEYLRQKKYKIIDRNWRTRQCEIDIVAKKKNTIYFIEVKYRKSADFGSGLDYITPKKQKQMAFAAIMWVSAHDYDGDYKLSAVEVTGSNFFITEFIEDI